MAIMNDATRQKVQTMFGEQLQNPVQLVLLHTESHPGEEEYTSASRELLTELAALSDGRMSFREIAAHTDPEGARAYGVDRFPALVFLDADGADQRFRFYGAPVGYEFMALLDDIVDVSRRQTRLSDAARSAIRAIDHEMQIQVFSTPT